MRGLRRSGIIPENEFYYGPKSGGRRQPDKKRIHSKGGEEVKNKGNVFYESLILSLALLFILLMAVAFEKDREHRLEVYAKDQRIYELQSKLDEIEDLYGKAVYYIEMMNKEREQ